MGAGNFAAGQGFGGADPVLDPSLPPVFRFPDAIHPLIETGSFKLEQRVELSGLTWASIHPVDQAVILAFMIRRGTYAPAPEIGATFREITRISGQPLIEEVKAAVRVARPFSDMVSQKFVEHVGTKVENPKRGEFRVAIEYRNLRVLAERNRRLFNLNTGDGTGILLAS